LYNRNENCAILRARVAADRPTLAICLGAQILAQALGARVYAGPKEIGWAPVTLTEAGERSVLCDIGRDAIPVLDWHGDTFDLPDGAARLASTPGCVPHSPCSFIPRWARGTSSAG